MTQPLMFAMRASETTSPIVETPPLAMIDGADKNVCAPWDFVERRHSCLRNSRYIAKA